MIVIIASCLTITTNPPNCQLPRKHPPLHTKVETYVIKTPEEKANPLYPEVRNNITKAAQAGGIKLIITIDTSWAGNTTIYF